MSIVALSKAFIDLVTNPERPVAVWHEASFDFDAHHFEIRTCTAPVDADGAIDVSDVKEKIIATAHVDYYDTIGVTLWTFERTMESKEATELGYVARRDAPPFPASRRAKTIGAPK